MEESLQEMAGGGTGINQMFLATVSRELHAAMALSVTSFVANQELPQQVDRDDGDE